MRAFLILLSALLLSASASAQDLLVKQNGEQMRVKVLKITKKKVEFVRFGTELPVYSLPISDIAYIEYPLGDRDTFGREVAPTNKSAQEPQHWHGAVPTPDGRTSVDVSEVIAKKESAPQQPQEPQRWHGAVAPHTDKSQEIITPRTHQHEVTYEIGDIYDQNGVKGIVVMTQNEGRNGIVMSVDEVCLAWSTLKRKQLKMMGATDRQDGEKNMQAIEKYIADNGLSWKDFPAFEWCKAKGDGWYLPSINEIWSAGTMYMGGSRTATNRRFRKTFNDRLIGAGGTPLSNIMYYHSSTEDKDSKYSLYTHMNSEAPFIQSGFKADDLFVRAFHKF